MPRPIGVGTPPSSGSAGPSRRSRRSQQHSSSSSSRSSYTTLLQASGLFLILYSLSIVFFQHAQLKQSGFLSTDVSSIIASTKDAFVTTGRGSLSRKGESGTADDDSNSWHLSDFMPEQIANIGETFGLGLVDDTMPRDKYAILDDGDDNNKGEGGGYGSIIPIDLSVNFLKPITKAPGAPPEPIMSPHASNTRPSEDFLPVVVPSSVIFRWAHRAREGSSAENSSKIIAYQILVRKANTEVTVWDSDKITIEEGESIPDSIDWGGSTTVGQILEWQVTIWDAVHNTHASIWSKFAVGPESEQDWKANWITHPHDLDTFDRKKTLGRDGEHDCQAWKLRRPLPLFRTKVQTSELHSADASVGPITSALLVISGLGSFRASFDGVPLSTSGPIDPPFTDYSKRVMYRGFDITSFLSGAEKNEVMDSHVIGVTLGSGWWDHRPVSGMAKPKLLPRGPVTVIAQIIVTYENGETSIIGQTGGGDMNKWQVSRGHIRESDLFTGEMVDLEVFHEMEGWDTTNEWSESTALTTDGKYPFEEVNKWTIPVEYHTEVTSEERKTVLAIRSKALERVGAPTFPRRQHTAAPIGRLVPSEIPPVMAMERIAPDEIHDLGGGRWLLDYGKAFSGMLHFDEGVPTPIIPEEYPRAHGFKAASEKGDPFMTVIYGESLEMTTGDINRVLVAGLGLHDGGHRHVSKPEGKTRNSYCFPEDHEAILSQKDVYVISEAAKDDSAALFAKARQSHFTTHSFRFAEVCCSAEPPKNAHALVYRTAVQDWGKFDSSNVNINGGYELVKNAMVSNMLSVQSDCPHREKLPYGGDLIADSPAAMHMFDMSAFYKKTVVDWLDAQWDNGAYTETSVWQDLNDYAGIGHGAGETVWATAPPVLTVRHMQHYGDIALLKESLDSHVRWIDFLGKHFEAGMLKKEYDEDLNNYFGQKSGLGDWLAMRSRDTWLTHNGFYMAAGRCVAYVARKVGLKDIEEKGLAVAKKQQERIVRLYLKNGKDNFDFPKGSASHTPGPEMSLFSRIVPGEKRCTVLKNWFQRSGHTWPGDEERRFLREVSEDDKQVMIETGELSKRGNDWSMGWSQWQGLNEGIFAIRYALKTLSETGFHNIALRKAAGFGFGTAEYMMRHNATTMWESWWRSEDLYSRNHPMLGAVAEWMAASAGGVSYYPTTTGSKKMLFAPGFPKSANTLQYASTTQGTIRGEYSIAWRFEDLPSDKSQYDSATVKIRVRMLVPPGGEAVARPPIFTSSSRTSVTLKQATTIPDVFEAKILADEDCGDRRKSRRYGFPYSWEYDRFKEKWYRLESGKSIGTPCESYLFHSNLDHTEWGDEEDITKPFSQREDVPVGPGLYEIVFLDWQLEKEVEGTGRIGNIPEYYKSEDLGPYCKDESTFEWDLDDATHII